ncbi:bifunctional diguanylate cyclase/phosphodiesterase, partial [Rhizobium johnstonii]
HGAALSLILAIVLTHFTGIAGLTIVPDATVAAPTEIISDGIITGLVSAVMIIILALGASTYIIDRRSSKVSACPG